MRRSLILLVGIVLAIGVPARAGEPAPLPNLVPYPPSGMFIGAADQGTGNQALRLSTSTVNLGAHLQLIGLPPRNQTTTDAQQCVMWQGRVCLLHETVGKFQWHPDHSHWHFAGYAEYELRSLTPEGTPDWSSTGLIRTSGKISFCLIDVSRTPEAESFPQDPWGSSGFYTQCTGLFQGISHGWADIYGWYLPGQQIVTDGLPSGRYAVTITINPDRILRETNYDDNTSHRIVEIQGGDVTVVG